MARKPDYDELQQLDDGIQEQPGQAPSFWSRLFGWRREKVVRHLTTLNDEGHLYYEDEDGGIYPVDW